MSAVFMWTVFSLYSHLLPSGRAGENVVPEPADEAQEAAAEGAGRAEAARRAAGPIRGQLERERTEREELGGAETRTGDRLVPAGGERRRRGHRG